MKKIVSIAAAVSMLVAAPLALASSTSHASRVTGHRLAQSSTSHRASTPSHAATTTPSHASNTSHGSPSSGHSTPSRRAH